VQKEYDIRFKIKVMCESERNKAATCNKWYRTYVFHWQEILNILIATNNNYMCNEKIITIKKCRVEELLIFFWGVLNRIEGL